MSQLVYSTGSAASRVASNKGLGKSDIATRHVHSSAFPGPSGDIREILPSAGKAPRSIIGKRTLRKVDFSRRVVQRTSTGIVVFRTGEGLVVRKDRGTC